MNQVRYFTASQKLERNGKTEVLHYVRCKFYYGGQAPFTANTGIRLKDPKHLVDGKLIGKQKAYLKTGAERTEEDFWKSARTVNGFLTEFTNKIISGLDYAENNDLLHEVRADKKYANSFFRQALKASSKELLEAGKRKVSFWDAWEEYRSYLLSEVSKDRAYKLDQTKRLLKETERKHGAISFKSIDKDWGINFRTVVRKGLNTEKRNEREQISPTTYNARLKQLKAFMRWAMETKEYHSNTKFTGIKPVKVAKKEPVFLTLPELLRLATLDLKHDPRYEFARDVLLFLCDAGCRVSEMKALRAEQIKSRSFKVWSTKTKQTKEYFFTAMGEQILKKYVQEGRELAFPKFNEQKVNQRLKEIAEWADITDNVLMADNDPNTWDIVEVSRPKCELITTHVGRKTKTNRGVASGLSKEDLMRLTGHEDVSTLKHYASEVEQAKKLTEELESPVLLEVYQKSQGLMKVS